MLSVLDVDVPRRMLSVDKEHPDDNSIEAAYLRHLRMSSSSLSSPNFKLPRRKRRDGAATGGRAEALAGRFRSAVLIVLERSRVYGNGVNGKVSP